MKNLIRHILLEESQKWEYQIRDIGGPVYYKRQKGGNWLFIDEAEFYKDSNRNNTVKWVEKKPKNQPKVKQIEVPQGDVDEMEYLYVYYQNLTYKDYKVEKTDDSIIIKVK
jgi:hypothetical protein